MAGALEKIRAAAEAPQGLPARIHHFTASRCHIKGPAHDCWNDHASCTRQPFSFSSCYFAPSALIVPPVAGADLLAVQA